MSWRDQVSTVVLVMLENRSFDHLLGHLSLEGLSPRVNGLRAPLTAYENLYAGGVFNPFPFQRDDPLAGDLPHEWDEVAVQLGADRGYDMGGFVEAYAAFRGRDPGPRPDPMGFFPSALAPISSWLARTYATCDRWHCPLPSSTQPNRCVAWTGTSKLFATPTGGLHFIDHDDLLLDWLDRAGVRYRVYHDGLSFFALFGPRAWGHVLGPSFRDFEHYLRDMQQATPDTAPQVILVEPSYDDGPHIGPDHPNDNHAPLPIGWGEDFLRRIYEAATANPAVWARTVFVLYYDEHGGFYDHVPPPPLTLETRGATPHRFTSAGPRVPAVVASPLVRPGTVCSALLDHTSVLQLLAELFTPGVPYSAEVEARRQQGVASLSVLLGDERRADLPPAPSDPIPAAATLGAQIAAPPTTGMRQSFEAAANALIAQEPAATSQKYPELFQWKAAVDAARRTP